MRWKRIEETIGGTSISPSMLGKYLHCPMQWYYRYVEREKTPARIVMATGSAVHMAAAMDMENTIEDGKHLPVKDLQEIAVADFENRLDDIELTEKEQEKGKDLALAEAKDRTVDLVSLYAKKAEPLRAKDVEMTLEGRFNLGEDTIDLIGKPDALLVNDEVLDFKTVKSVWPTSRLENDLQITIYSMLADAEKIALFFMKQGKRKGEAKIVEATRTTKQKIRALNLIVRILDSIEAGIFPPADPTSWVCSKNYCDYWNICPFGGKN